VKGSFANTFFSYFTPCKKKCIYPKVSFVIYVLICGKLSEVCENKDLGVIIQKYELFYARS
jgi:hypothetical protein